MCRHRASTRQWAEEASKPKEGDQAALRIETLDGTLVGWISVGRTERRNGLFTYAVGIGREHWRRGYGSEAVILLLRFYFAELAYRKVETKVYSFNEASLRFHDCLGFTREGCRRAAQFTAGEYHDVILFGMTAQEFFERHGSGERRSTDEAM